MKQQSNEKSTEKELWTIGWLCLILSVFLFGIAFVLGDFPTYVYRIPIAFAVALLTAGFGCLFTVAVRTIKNDIRSISDE